MRVIAGSARRLQLKTIEGLDTRPTTDRIKETLFNMLQNDLAGCRFLDLFAGSGAIGIEALSRGAREAVFVEKSPQAAACIRDNLKATRLEGQARILREDVFQALERLKGGEPFDYIFLDPPYRNMLEEEVLGALKGASLLAEDGVIIIEASKDTGFSWLEELGYTLVKRKEYKTNVHVFVKQEETSHG